MTSALSNAGTVFNRIDHLQPGDLALTPAALSFLTTQLTTRIGQGGAAQVYATSNPNLVVKIYDPCSYETTGQAVNRAVQLYCRSIKNPNSIQIEPTDDGKQLLIVPNYLLEGIIGLYVTTLSSYTPHFANYTGVYLSPTERRSYTIIERYQTDLGSQIRELRDVYYMLFQVAQGLSVGQEEFKLTHYDLHGDNILYSLVPESIKTFSYPILTESGVGEFLLYNRRYSIKISDFGLSRIELATVVLDPSVDTVPIASRGVFNPAYDFIALIGFLLNNNSFDTGSMLITNIRKVWPLKEQNQLLSVLFNRSPDRGETDRQFNDRIRREEYFVDANGSIKWRPANPSLIEYVNGADIYQIVEYLVSKLVSLSAGVVRPRSTRQQQTGVVSYRPLPAYRLLFGLRDRVATPLSQNRTTYREIGPGMKMYSYQYNLSQLPASYNWTLTKKAIANCPTNSQYIHVLYVDTAVARRAGYQMTVRCCKIDPMDYMDDKFGFAVNGGFFDINGNYQAIGPYRELLPDQSRYYETGLPIPPLYSSYYGAVAIKDGQLSLYSNSRDQQLIGADYVLSSGPVLIAKGVPLITAETMEIVKTVSGQPVKIFQCDQTEKSKGRILPAPVQKVNYRRSGAGKNGCQKSTESRNTAVFNCATILPGELSHGSNPNQRTMVLTRRNDDRLGNLAFVVVEGRDERGMGVDLVQLTNIAASLKAIDAINLDGGRSSNIAWRTPDHPDIVDTINPSHLYTYPVGTVIGFTRSR